MTKTQEELLQAYAAILAEQNERMNLVGNADPRVLEVRHIKDSLSILPPILEACPELETLIDVGSGAGLPGIPLAIALPGVQVTLLDALGKRCAFLEETAARLGLANVTVVNARAEEAARGPLRDRFDASVSRAVAKLPMLCELCLPLLRPGGVFFAMKSRRADEELADAARAVKRLGAAQAGRFDYALPPYPGEEGGVELTAFLFRKETATPDAYPRSFAAIKKRPL